jgi:hypothetical protein
MSFNIPSQGSSTEIKIPPNVQYVIGVDNIEVVTLPSGSSPTVTHNADTNTLTFYLAQGATGSQGIQGEQGVQGIQGIQGLSGAKGTSGENGKTPLYEFSYNDVTGDLEYTLIGYDELATTPAQAREV